MTTKEKEVAVPNTDLIPSIPSNYLRIASKLGIKPEKYKEGIDQIRKEARAARRTWTISFQGEVVTSLKRAAMHKPRNGGESIRILELNIMQDAELTFSVQDSSGNWVFPEEAQEVVLAGSRTLIISGQDVDQYLALVEATNDGEIVIARADGNKTSMSA